MEGWNINRRISDAQKDLERTFIADTPRVKVYYKKYDKNFNELESYVHRKLNKVRYRPDREFFKITPKEAKKIIIDCARDLKN